MDDQTPQRKEISPVLTKAPVGLQKRALVKSGPGCYLSAADRQGRQTNSEMILTNETQLKFLKGRPECLIGSLIMSGDCCQQILGEFLGHVFPMCRESGLSYFGLACPTIQPWEGEGYSPPPTPTRMHNH